MARPRSICPPAFALPILKSVRGMPDQLCPVVYPPPARCNVTAIPSINAAHLLEIRHSIGRTGEVTRSGCDSMD